MPQNIVAAQKALQAAKGYVHLRSGAMDKVTSMLIPAAFAVTGITLLVKGIDDLSWGKNRKEGF